ncbi:hypothetical protein JCM5353_005635 [Sporobolomyces roseus]
MSISAPVPILRPSVPQPTSNASKAAPARQPRPPQPAVSGPISRRQATDSRQQLAAPSAAPRAPPPPASSTRKRPTRSAGAQPQQPQQPPPPPLPTAVQRQTASRPTATERPAYITFLKSFAAIEKQTTGVKYYPALLWYGLQTYDNDEGWKGRELPIHCKTLYGDEWVQDKIHSTFATANITNFLTSPPLANVVLPSTKAGETKTYLFKHGAQAIIDAHMAPILAQFRNNPPPRP